MIYLDHNATTPVLPEVLDAMLPWLKNEWGNPSSIHTMGRAAKRAVEKARAEVAGWLGAQPDQVVFTSGATESNNAAIHSALKWQPGKRHIVTSAVEHSAVLAYCDYLQTHSGVDVTKLTVDEDGQIDPEELGSAIRPDTALVSLMWANNETGVIWPIPEFADICNRLGVPLHTDAVQCAGKIPIAFCGAGPDFLSISGHKFGAPKGIGALLLKEPAAFVPWQYGGKQENGHRAGTENVGHIVALGAAAQACRARNSDAWSGVEGMRDRFETQVRNKFSGAVIHGCKGKRLPNTLNIHFPGLDGDALVTFLDSQEICVSSGSACLESAISPSHVIYAMTGSHEQASESVRVSVGLASTEADLSRLMGGLEAFAAFER